MVRARVTKAVNPHRRKLSLKQLAAGFGGKRRQSALKTKRRSSAKKHRHAAPKAASNPKRKKANAKKRRRSTAKRRNATPKVVYRTRTKVVTKRVYVGKKKRKATAKRRRSTNPGYLLTMSPVGNPTVRKTKRRKTTMAKHRRKASAKSRSGKKRNPTRRRSIRRRSVRRHVSRNPFGLTSSTVVKKGIGVFAGFSAAKKVPPMLGPTANSSPMMSLLTTAGVAALAAWLANRFAPGPIAEGVALGGVAGVVNVAWNAWAPSQVSGYFGVGDIVPGSFPLPQTPVRFIAGGGDPSQINQAPVNVGAFGSAW